MSYIIISGYLLRLNEKDLKQKKNQICYTKTKLWKLANKNIEKVNGPKIYFPHINLQNIKNQCKQPLVIPKVG